ncbi:hypothetical protein MMC29_007602 [Sticta canariensis]|nr:hypothetical protein [Sticta canariensis]
MPVIILRPHARHHPAGTARAREAQEAQGAGVDTGGKGRTILEIYGTKEPSGEVNEPPVWYTREPTIWESPLRPQPFHVSTCPLPRRWDEGGQTNEMLPRDQNQPFPSPRLRITARLTNSHPITRAPCWHISNQPQANPRNDGGME